MTSYIKIGAMLALCLIFPPFGWLFMYKYSPFDKKTNIMVAAACTVFFVNAIATSPDFKNIIAPFSGDSRAFEQKISPEDFREQFNASAKKLAPNLGMTIAAPLSVDEKIFRYEFTPTLALEGHVNAERNITALKIFAEPKTKDESFQTINVLGLLIATLNPELDRDDRSEVLRDLRMLKEVFTEGSYDWTTMRRNVKYSVHADTGKVTFTAELNR